MSKPLALIIEDDVHLMEIFALALQGAGFETRTVTDGQQALDILAEWTPDVVVLDLNLPHVSGKEILHFVRSQERFAQTRVILATANAPMADALRADSDLVLLKPISPSQLRDLAQRLRPGADT